MRMISWYGGTVRVRLGVKIGNRRERCVSAAVVLLGKERFWRELLHFSSGGRSWKAGRFKK